MIQNEAIIYMQIFLKPTTRWNMFLNKIPIVNQYYRSM